MKYCVYLLALYGVYTLLFLQTGSAANREHTTNSCVDARTGKTLLTQSTTYQKALVQIEYGDTSYQNRNVSSSSVYIIPPDTNTSCPSRILADARAELSDRSLCPWYTIINRDPYRIPKVLLEARCKCNSCVFNPGSPLHTQCLCEQVYQSVRVLSQIGQCTDGQHVYSYMIEKIPVACTCAKRREVISG